MEKEILEWIHTKQEIKRMREELEGMEEYAAQLEAMILECDT